MATKEEALRRVERSFREGKQVCLNIWSVEDIIGLCRDHGKTITVEDAESVLMIADEKQDACQGVNWEILWIYAQDVIAQREEEIKETEAKWLNQM